MSYSEVPNDIYSVFKAKLKTRFGDLLQFPETIHFDTNYKVMDRAAIEFRSMRNCWEVSFVVKDSEMAYMDYYALSDHNSHHQRMDQMGNVIDLENFEEQFGWPVYEDEIKTQETHEAIRQHNQNVQQILETKGLLK